MKTEKPEVTATNRDIIKKDANLSTSFIVKEKARILTEYGTFESVMLKHVPSSNENISLLDASRSNAPSLSYLDIVYGEGSAITWLVVWLTELYAACGFIGQVTNKQKVVTAEIIRKEYHYLNILEMEVFFRKFMAGKYKTFYNTPNLQVITSSLAEFVKDRNGCAPSTQNRTRKPTSLNKPIPFAEWQKLMRLQGKETILKEIGVKANHSFMVTEKYKEAESIYYNMSGSDFASLAAKREGFVQRYGECPYDYYKKLNKENK